MKKDTNGMVDLGVCSNFEFEMFLAWKMADRKKVDSVLNTHFHQ